MKYSMYRLSFPVGVHFGDNSLYDSQYTIAADTLFSALYIEALKQGQDMADMLLEKVKQGDILFSDTFPYIGEKNYLPKPMLPIETQEEQGKSDVKKAFKSLSYIPMDKMDSYLQGTLDAKAEKDCLKGLGKSELKTSVSLNGGEEPEPYHVGVYYFNEACGIYFIVGIENEDDEQILYDLIDALSFSGIGGKRSAGLGRFEIESKKVLDHTSFESDGEYYMLLSSALPTETELNTVFPEAKYQLKKKSGFVASDTYAQEQRKKKDMYLFVSGSCFKQRFHGDVYDVSDGGSHSVHRYAIPMFFTLK